MSLADLLGTASTQTPVPVPVPVLTGKDGKVEVVGNVVRVFTRRAITAINTVPGRKWRGYEGEFGVNELPLALDSLRTIERFDLDGVETVREALSHQSAEEARKDAERSAAVEASLAEDGKEVVLDGQSDEWAYRAYQSAGIDAMLGGAERWGGTLNADQMGLGKTGQAIGAVALSGGRTLVVAPPAVRSNWAREITRILPEATVTILEGQTPYRIENAEWVIVTYSVLAYWVDALLAEGFDNLILDEAHNIKRRQAAWSKAALKLAQAIN